jgi:hypothetical protein
MLARPQPRSAQGKSGIKSTCFQSRVGEVIGQVRPPPASVFEVHPEDDAMPALDT